MYYVTLPSDEIVNLPFNPVLRASSSKLCSRDTVLLNDIYKTFKRKRGETGAMGRTSRLGTALKRIFNQQGSETDAIEAVELPLNQQYRIPPPEDGDSTLFHGVRAVVSLRFMDLCVWVSVLWPPRY